MNSTTNLTFDFDGISVWASTLGMTTPSASSRGEFCARVAVPRILKVLEREDVSATFFTPGKTVETWPEVCSAVLDGGHEIAHHGYRHVSPVGMTEAEEREEIERGLEAMDRHLGGYRPRGYRSPASDFSPNTARLLHEYGFTYDSTLSAQDFEPYWCRTGDVVDSDGNVTFGPEISLVEIPFSWSLDDFPQMEFVLGALEGLADPQKCERMWLADLEFMVEDVPGGVYCICFHPQVIARGARTRVLERIIARGKELSTVFATGADIAATWRAENAAPTALERDAK